MEQQETLEIVTQPENGVVIFEQFKEAVLQSFDKQVLARVNPLQTRLNELKIKYEYAGVITDKKSFDFAKEAVAAFRTFKGDAEDERKKWKSISLRMGEISDEHYSPLREESERLQKGKDAAAKAWDDEQRAIRNAEKIALAKRKALRFDQLTQLGAFTSSGVFILGDETAMEDTVELRTDEGFDEILGRFKAEKEKNDAEAAEVERKRQEEAENLRQQQEQLRIQREEMIKREQMIQEQQESLRRQQEELAKKERERIAEQEKKDRWEKAEAERMAKEEAAEKRMSILRSRSGKLDDVVIAPSGVFYNDTRILSADEYTEMPADLFEEFAANHNSANAVIKAEAERKQKEEEESKRKEAEIAEKRKLRLLLLAGLDLTSRPETEPFIGEWSDEDWNKLYLAAKESFDAKKQAEWLENERIKKAQEEEREKERLAELTDGERWRVFKTELSKFAANMPHFPTGRYARMKAIALEKFGEIQTLKYENFKGNKKTD